MSRVGGLVGTRKDAFIRTSDSKRDRSPVLRGTIRGRLPDVPLPEAVAEGREPFLDVGAIAGG